MLTVASRSPDDWLTALVTRRALLDQAEASLPPVPLRDAVIILLDALRRRPLETLSARQRAAVARCAQRVARGRLDASAVYAMDVLLYDAGLDWVMKT